MLRTLLAGLFLTLYLLLLGPPFILHARLTRRIGPLYKIGITAARWAVRIAGVRVRIEGTEKIPRTACVFVANHTSNIDPPALVPFIPRRVALLAKKEVFRVPILGAALRTGAFIPVDRADKSAAREAVEEALAHLREGISYCVFPEGTRSRDGRLQHFKRGTFVMAIRARVPVVPITIIGSHEILPRGSFRIRPAILRIVVHPPIETSSLTLHDRDRLTSAAHSAIASALPPTQKPHQET